MHIQAIMTNKPSSWHHRGTSPNVPSLIQTSRMSQTARQSSGDRESEGESPSSEAIGKEDLPSWIKNKHQIEAGEYLVLKGIAWRQKASCHCRCPSQKERNGSEQTQIHSQCRPGTWTQSHSLRSTYRTRNTWPQSNKIHSKVSFDTSCTPWAQMLEFADHELGGGRAWGGWTVLAQPLDWLR